MNLASWIILAIVIAVIGLAIKATFFGKKKGGCCDCGDAPAAHARAARARAARAKECGTQLDEGCGACTGCPHCK